jgi:hypothetical protein
VTGYFGGYFPAYFPPYFPGRGGATRPPRTYRPSAPTGWKSEGRRKGPDPDQSTGIRKAGLG